MLAWFRNRGRIAQLGILVAAVAAVLTLWSLLVTLAGYLLRGWVWRWVTRRLLRRLVGWAGSRFRSGGRPH